MVYAALIGDPVNHSVAPYLHEALARRLGLEFRYLKIKVEQCELEDSLRALQQLGFAGCNVTIPHKEEVAAHLDQVDEVSHSLGAVNTIVFGRSGSVGTNTDWRGIVDGLRHAGMPDENANGKAVVFGSGGAARAAIFALKHLGYKTITLHYVTPADPKTMRLMGQADELGIVLLDYSSVERTIEEANLVCNMTSTGMVGQEPFPFPLMRLDPIDLSRKYFLDAVFNPIRTPLIEYFENRGAKSIDGIWMMLYQGIPAFEAWTGRKLTLTDSEVLDLHEMLVREVVSLGHV